jgi:glycosyltransferase involved in cell wall biosynthesis
MRVAFYAPMKPPDHPTPSGDRRMARLLIEALSAGGHHVGVACRFRSRDTGVPVRQTRIAKLGSQLAECLVRRYRARPAHQRPQVWFTYHLYYKAPDYLGPKVCDALGIPYIAAEASHAGKRAGTNFAVGHDAAANAIRRADALIILNGADLAGLQRIADPSRCHRLLPFVDDRSALTTSRAEARSALARELNIAEDEPWILAVAMMRAPDKLASYHLLADAMLRLRDLPWRLLVVGDGPEREAIVAAFAPVASRVTFAGLRSAEEIQRFHAAADVFAWPAINEAYGMALLEAEADGLPVIAGACGGVPEIVADGETGLLCTPGDAAAFAAALARLLKDADLRERLGRAAARRVTERHGFNIAVTGLDNILKRVA